MNHTTLLFLGTEQDKVYLPRLKPMLGTMHTYFHLSPISTWAEVLMVCKKKNITGIISTSQVLLKKLTYLEKSNPSIDNYAGSLFVRDGIEVVFIDPLEHLITVPYGKFLISRFISKLTSPENWVDVKLSLSNSFSFSMLEPDNAESMYSICERAQLLAVDIETFKHNLAIRCVGFTAVTLDSSGRYTTTSFVAPLDNLFSLGWVRKILSTPAAKIFQNGKYDISYLSRYNIIVHNYMWDTANLFHCMHPELPKDLGFLKAFFVRNAQYWKDLAETSDLREYYLYNAKDTWGTALAFLGMMLEIETYAKTNYLQEFPLVFPCHLSEMTGIRMDETKRVEQEKHFSEIIKKETESLGVMLGAPGFNPNSHVQVKKLLKVLGCGDIESSNEKDLNKAMFRHPLNALLFSKILDIRGYRKLVSTYLVAGKDLNGRILYALNPHGTDTGRLASREHHFWCGLQIQNIPRGKDVKCTLVSDPDFVFYECDLEQAESRDTAHIAGDESLILAVSGERDFHSVNAAAFFAVSYESIYDQVNKKTLNKVLRDIAKKVNHGANYLMGPLVLVDTMGLLNIYKAAKALNLPKLWTPKQIAEFLLDRFHKTYPFLSQVFYPGVELEVKTTHKLTSKATHHVEYQATTAGWVRECFKDPTKDKRAKNAYVAHGPQSLNAMTLNKAYMKVFYDIALKYPRDFKLHAQIHDSILFSVRRGHEYLAQKVKECMEIPVTVKGYDGKVRTFTVPAALKGGKDGMGATRWSETE
jgi:DNA polymerase I-like protein with 3'-5' exonuclease and polymerase domains